MTWNGDKIVVMRDVVIDPPYRPETIRGKDESGVKYIRKIVSTYMYFKAKYIWYIFDISGRETHQ